MNRIWVVAKRELRSYFNSPIAYIAALCVVLFCAIWFFVFNRFFDKDIASIREYFAAMSIVFSLMIPALTMRSWAEERKLGTVELLLTLPFNELDVVLGKFLGAFCLFLGILACTIPVPIMLSFFGSFDAGQIVGEYIGAILLGAVSLSVGQLVSSLTKNQITAFIAGVCALLLLSQVNLLTQLVTLPDMISGLILYISFNYHFESFVKGLIDTRDLIYFVGLTALFLYLTVRVLVNRKWS